jgi:uncharacterized peroxidase-related enzyme
MKAKTQRLQQVNPEKATGQTKELLNAVKAKLGKVPNTFQVMANSPVTLAAFLGFMGKLEEGSLPFETRNQIALAVSEINKCSYCLSAFTAFGKGAGMKEEELLQCRRAGSKNPKVDAAIKLAQAIVKGRGEVPDDVFNRAKEAGYTDAEIEEITANVAFYTFINYINLGAKTEIDFPLVNPGKT